MLLEAILLKCIRTGLEKLFWSLILLERYHLLPLALTVVVVVVGTAAAVVVVGKIVVEEIVVVVVVRIGMPG